MANPADDLVPPFWRQMAQEYGTIHGIALQHPNQGIQAALEGNYHANDGNIHGGVRDWVDDHPTGDPGPAKADG